jgi:hypothetical protein
MTDIKPVTTDELGKPSPVPQPKVVAAGVAGAITVLVVFIVNTVWPDLTIPPEASSAFTVVISFIAGYIKRPSGLN